MRGDPTPTSSKTTFDLGSRGFLVFKGEAIPIRSMTIERVIQQYRADNGEVCYEDKVMTRVIVEEVQ